MTVELQCEDTRCNNCKEKILGLKQDTCITVEEKSISALLTVAPLLDFTSTQVNISIKLVLTEISIYSIYK